MELTLIQTNQTKQIQDCISITFAATRVLVMQDCSWLAWSGPRCANVGEHTMIADR